MGLVSKAAGKNWYYQFTYKDDEGKRKLKSVNTEVPSSQTSKKAKTKALEAGMAKKKAFLEELEQSRSRYINRRGKRRQHADDTVAEYAEYWLSEMKGSVEDNTLVSYQGPLKSHILPRIGHIRLSDLDQYDIKQFVLDELKECDERQKALDERRKKAKGKPIKIHNNEKTYYPSIKKHLAIIKMMLDYAVSEMDLDVNVAKLVNRQVLKKIPKSEFEPEPYNKEEIAVLREAIRGNHLETPIILASYLGLRREEALGLRWEDVDFEHDKIYIRHVCVLVGSKVVFRDKTKTKKSKAKLHMIRPLREYLLELKAKQEEEKAFCGSGYTETGLVCRREDGRIIKPENVSTGYKKILEKNGLRHTRFHDLRHTVGEIILEETGDIKLVADTLRHSNISTTADTYTRSSDESIAKGLEALDTR